MKVSHRNRRPVRGGKSLLEMMVVIVTSAMLVSLAGGLFHHLAQTNETFRGAAAAGDARMRLAVRFRGDARAAQTARLRNQDGKTRIEFVNGEATTTYVSDERGVKRIVSGGPVKHRDLFRLGQMEITFALDGGLARLNAMSRRDATSIRPVSPEAFRIIACVGADQFGARSAVDAKPVNPVAAPRPQEERP